jgi:hypothetical protein
MRNLSIGAFGSDGSGLIVEFVWQGDRYGHRISAAGPDGTMVALLESIEEMAADDWPHSPPLQTLSIETLPDGRHAALLVGMAGRGHWSASIEPTAGIARLIFDLACRHTQQPKFLGSRYRQLASATGRLMIQSESARIFAENSTLTVNPTNCPAPPSTTRWLYTVSLTSNL